MRKATPRLVATLAATIALNPVAAHFDGPRETVVDRIARIDIQQYLARPLPVLVFWLAATQRVAAQTTTRGGDQPCPPVPGPIVELELFLKQLQELGVAVGILLAVLTIVAAGILYIWPGVQKTQLAQELVVNTAIGLTIILLSSGLVQLVVDLLGCPGVG